MNILEVIRQPWPWYVAGPLIGLMVPFLMLIGNKSFGISSSLRHICAACIPGNLPFFKYQWKKEAWNLFFVAGVFVGGIICAGFLSDPDPLVIDSRLVQDLSQYGLNSFSGLMPEQLFGWPHLFSLRGFIMTVGGGFLVGFGTRYAGGCTSGHAIMGLSTLQLPSLIATCSFMLGGFIMTNLILPVILGL